LNTVNSVQTGAPLSLAACSKGLQSFDHPEDRNLALYEEILKEARSRFELGESIPRRED
jgi:hypothetical protein